VFVVRAGQLATNHVDSHADLKLHQKG